MVPGPRSCHEGKNVKRPAGGRLPRTMRQRHSNTGLVLAALIALLIRAAIT
jgi:hypothetical protein